MSATGDKLRAQAADHERDARESFDRCDTDGFLSQWASGINAQVDRRNAEIADHGGRWGFSRVRLERMDGTPVADARVCETRYGRKWRIDSADKWLPYNPARESTLAKYGYREVSEYEIGAAKAITWAPSGARGTGGCCSVSVIIIRTDRPKSEGWYPDGSPE